MLAPSSDPKSVVTLKDQSWLRSPRMRSLQYTILRPFGLSRGSLGTRCWTSPSSRPSRSRGLPFPTIASVMYDSNANSTMVSSWKHQDMLDLYVFHVWRVGAGPLAFVSTRLAPGDIFVDVGANVGW